MDPAVTIPQHTTPAERAAAAAAFAAEYTDRFSWPMACDTMDGAFLSTFGAWPTRFFAVADGKVAFKIEPNALGKFDPTELRQWLAQSASRTC